MSQCSLRVFAAQVDYYNDWLHGNNEALAFLSGLDCSLSWLGGGKCLVMNAANGFMMLVVDWRKYSFCCNNKSRCLKWSQLSCTWLRENDYVLGVNCWDVVSWLCVTAVEVFQCAINLRVHVSQCGVKLRKFYFQLLRAWFQQRVSVSLSD